MPRKRSSPPIHSVVSRRDFLAASSTVMLAGALTKSTAAETSGTASLALHGGEKAVKQSAPLPIRWGDPERERLNAMLSQDSLFYWRGPQTSLLIERFKKVCPVQYVMPCSSGTAALHIRWRRPASGRGTR